jgi:hypothetical protein
MSPYIIVKINSGFDFVGVSILFYYAIVMDDMLERRYYFVFTDIILFSFESITNLIVKVFAGTTRLHACVG